MEKLQVCIKGVRLHSIECHELQCDAVTLLPVGGCLRLSWYPSLVCTRVVRIIVSVSPIAAATTKYSGKDHRGNQDGVRKWRISVQGQNADDAETFVLL